MGREIDLLIDYPRTARDVEGRGAAKSDADRAVARRFDQAFFDGDRRHGYGGFAYSPRFWQPVVPALQHHFELTPRSSVLDVGCAKGFLMHDLAQLIPGLAVQGIDVSEYAIAHAIEDMRAHVQVADARSLPFPDASFDVVISINTIHNLDRDGCVQALHEIERVSRGRSYLTVDAYRTEEEKARIIAWNLTARTILHTEEWKALFSEAGYTGDYYWFIP
jgi:SAM-dependent methyltransferase